MLTCKECIEQLFPSDPRADGGCLYWCDKPESSRQLETQAPPEQVIVHRHSDMGKLEYDLLQQTARRAEHLEKKLNQLLKKRKPQDYEPF